MSPAALSCVLLQGQPMNCVYFVMSGVVEITKTATADDVERETSAGASIEHSFTVDIDESLMLDCSLGGLAHESMFPSGAVNGRLHIDRMKVRPSLSAAEGRGAALISGID
jgi:hypothetical protein